MGTNNTIHHGK